MVCFPLDFAVLTWGQTFLQTNDNIAAISPHIVTDSTFSPPSTRESREGINTDRSQAPSNSAVRECLSVQDQLIYASPGV